MFLRPYKQMAVMDTFEILTFMSTLKVEKI